MQIGTVLTIPNVTGTNPNNLFMYTVKPGDTLYSIARKYNTTVSAIKNLNYLSSDILNVGQIIRIPEMYTKEDEMIMPNYINYTVKKGDNLYALARLYNVSVDTIVKDNGLTNTNLSIGQILRIRVPATETVEECIGIDYTPPNSTTNNTLNYTVKKGDSLYKIANQYNTSVDTIRRLNNLTTNNLSIGQVLKIPANTDQVITYTVKSGDNLYSIARKYNTTVNSIKSKNNLTSDLLKIGQKLII